MTVTIEKANETYDAVAYENSIKWNGLGNKVENLPNGIVKETFQNDGWTYEFYSINNEIKKIVEWNHRELIEAWVK